MSTGKLESLPRWAQSHIKMLESNLADARKREDALFGRTPSPVCVDGWGVHPDQPLPPRATVTFKFDPKGFSYISVRLRDGLLYVMGSSGRLIILPESANTCNIGLTDTSSARAHEGQFMLAKGGVS